MIKLLIRLILSFCILFSSGYGQLYAHQHLESISHALLGADLDAAAAFQHDQTFIVKSPSNNIEKGIKIDALDIEEEESEISSSKKYMESSKVITAIFYAFTFDFFFRSIHNRLQLSKHFSNTSSYRWHLIIQVFRI
ncbi:hypothetical protein GCM10028791_33240 [Echinicola sediminis]